MKKFEIEFSQINLKLQNASQQILKIYSFFFFLEFQPMTSTPNDNSLLSDQDTNQFLE